jgi:hypothetical protein
MIAVYTQIITVLDGIGYRRQRRRKELTITPAHLPTLIAVRSMARLASKTASDAGENSRDFYVFWLSTARRACLCCSAA